MKKQLLASSMLAAVGALTVSGAAQAKFNVSVNGYFESVLGTSLADNEDVFNGTSGTLGNRAAADVHNEAEIHFNASTELDNGISIRAHVELELGAGVAGGADTIDEQYIVVRGNFGQLTLGSEDNAGHLMTIGYLGSWATNAGQNLTFDVGDFITRPYRAKFDGTLNDPRLRSTDNDSDKITYYTPRMGGFQVGVSYIPNVTQDDSGRFASTEDVYNDGWALGANFQRKFGNFGLGVGAGYLTMSAPESTGNGEDAEAYTISARFDFGPVRIAAGFKENIEIMDSGGASTGTSLAGTIYDIGARLTMGPNRFSLTYAHGEMDGDLATAADREETAAMLSYGRTLGPGVVWTANLIWGEFIGDAPAATVAAAGATSQESDGVAVSTSLKLRF